MGNYWLCLQLYILLRAERHEFSVCMQVPKVNSSCFNLNKTLQSNAVCFFLQSLLFIVYSLAFKMASTGLELQSETVFILDT